MNMKLCSRCKKNPAVIYISKIEGDKTTQEGLCIKCAMEMNIGPIKDMMSNGIDIDGYGRMIPTKIEFDLQDAEVNNH